MIVLGLTGSVGMGKTATAKMFADEGVPVFDADAAVHELYEGEAAPLIAAAFPGTVSSGRVDRERLSRAVVGNSEAFARLEAIIHPLVRKAREKFLSAATAQGAEVVVLDIPLLLETGGEREVDKIVVVSAPHPVQKERVLARPAMTAEKFGAIVAKQMPDSEKRKRADFVVDTSRGFEAAREEVRAILRALAKPKASGKIMREIVLDTETTGLDPFTGHRIVEIGCIELVNCISTSATFHVYLNPERDMPAEAEAIHGLSSAFLADKPKFADVAEGLVEFLGDAKLVIHNAGFDLTFLNAELDRLKRPPIARDRVVDTLALARRRHPGGPNRLDDLCARYGIDNSRRTKHGALLDAELLAEVYAELVGGRQARFSLDRERTAVRTVTVAAAKERPAPLSPRLTSEETNSHRALLSTLGTDSVWCDYLAEE